MDATEKIINPALPTAPQLRVVHYLLSRQNGKFVAHCLDFDVLCVAASLQEASQKLDDLVKAHIEYSCESGQLVNLTTKAPMTYWKQFFAGKNVDLGARTIHITIPDGAQFIPLDSPEAELGVLARELTPANAT